MWPRIGPIPTYGIFYFSGTVLYFLVARRIARRAGLRRRVWIVLGLCYLLGMTVGAKILFDLRHGQFEFAALLSLPHWTQGGMWGGMLAYFVLAVPLALLLTKRRRAALDLVALSLPIPWIMAKVGCFFNGCCHGKPCSLPWAITFPEGARGAPAGVPLHPTQLYEIGIMLILLALFVVLRSDRWRGTKLFWFLLVYGFGRAATDFLRGEANPTFLGPLTLTQVLCAAAAVIALAVLALVRPKAAASI
jgi:phosphatidylglycerol---prolipoprotein diacylglyceryl transferase